MFKTCWGLFLNVLDISEISEHFSMFRIRSKSWPSRVHWAKKIKRHLETCSKRVWTLLGTFLDIFENFRFFLNFFYVRWAKKFFRQNHLKTSSKHVGDFFGNILGHFWKFGSFSILLILSKSRPSRVHCAKIFFETNHLKTCSKRV